MEKDLNEKPLSKITARTSRAELLKAYNEAMARLEQTPEGKAQEPAKVQEKRTVEKASGYTVENIIKGLAELQIGIGKALNDLGEKLTREAGKLAELGIAIELKTSQLKELNDIEYNVGTLSALLEAQALRKTAFEQAIQEEQKSFKAEMAEKKQTFDAEITKKREEWKKEQQDYESALKDRDLLTKKQREREEDEYKYKLATERKKEAVEYEVQQLKLQRTMEEKSEKFEKEIAERETDIARQENKMIDLQKKVEQFPRELEETEKKVEAAIRFAMKQQYDMETQLAAKDTEAQKKLSEIKVKNLEDIVSKQQMQIADLSKQVQTANKQVQEMAVKAIEGASGIKARASFSESGTEQPKGVGIK